MEAAPHLRLIDAETGEEVQRDRSYEELETLLERYKAKLDGALSENGKLRKEIADVRELEPEAKVITGILEFWLDWSGRSTCHIDSSTDRWKYTAQRLKQKPNKRGEKWTPQRLKTAIVGSPRHEYLGKKRNRQDPAVIFQKSEWTEECEHLAGLTDQPVKRQQAVSDLSPIEAAAHCLAREFGLDAIHWAHDDRPERKYLDEVWGPCPLHPVPWQTPLRIRELTRERGMLEVRCVEGCEPEAIYDALRGLYGLQAARSPQHEIAALRVRVVELERALQVYAHEWRDWSEVMARDRGHAAREALKVEAA